MPERHPRLNAGFLGRVGGLCPLSCPISPHCMNGVRTTVPLPALISLSLQSFSKVQRSPTCRSSWGHPDIHFTHPNLTIPVARVQVLILGPSPASILLCPKMPALGCNLALFFSLGLLPTWPFLSWLRFCLTSSMSGDIYGQSDDSGVSVPTASAWSSVQLSLHLPLTNPEESKLSYLLCPFQKNNQAGIKKENQSSLKFKPSGAGEIGQR